MWEIVPMGEFSAHQPMLLADAVAFSLKLAS
jgi:hypothetical protein